MIIRLLSKFKKHQDIVLIASEEENFISLSHILEDHNIHWLKEDGEEFIWQKSHGVLTRLREFINEKIIEVNKENKITEIKDRVAIIAAESGMGKSTLLTHLEVQTKISNPSLSTVRINLSDYSTESAELDGQQINFNELEALQFIHRTIGFQLFQKKKEETKEKQKERVENILSSITVKIQKHLNNLYERFE